MKIFTVFVLIKMYEIQFRFNACLGWSCHQFRMHTIASTIRGGIWFGAKKNAVKSCGVDWPFGDHLRSCASTTELAFPIFMCRDSIEKYLILACLWDIAHTLYARANARKRLPFSCVHSYEYCAYARQRQW